MTSRETLKAVTANAVLDGVTVYMTAAGEWSPKIADAITLADCTAELAKAQSDRLRVIAPYIIDVTVTSGTIRPVGLREEIRAFGPTA